MTMWKRQRVTLFLQSIEHFYRVMDKLSNVCQANVTKIPKYDFDAYFVLVLT